MTGPRLDQAQPVPPPGEGAPDSGGGPQPADTYVRLLPWLDRNGASYRVLEHPPEGRTGAVGAMRGHPVSQAAKCIVLIVKTERRDTRFVLAVVPGDKRFDTGRIKALLEATYAGFAATNAARLDWSLALRTRDYAALAKPRLERIAVG